jgi:Flp pilus assembly protein TadG
MTISSAFSLRAILPRLLRDNGGVTAVTVAVSLSALLGLAGLGVDTGMWYTIKRQNQSAVDAAAISAAYEVMAGNTNNATYLTPAASAAATRNNYSGTTPVVTYPYGDALVSSGVLVTLQKTQNSWFAAVLGVPSVTIANRAVAIVKTLDTSCILALGGTGTDVDVVGSASVCLGPLSGGSCGKPTCSITADSTSSSAIHLQGAASVTADTLVTPGQVGFTGGGYTLTLNSPALIGAPPVADPYASTLTHSFLVNGPPAMPTTTTCTKTGTTWSTNCKIAGTSISVGDTFPLIRKLSVV